MFLCGPCRSYSCSHNGYSIGKCEWCLAEDFGTECDHVIIPKTKRGGREGQSVYPLNRKPGWLIEAVSTAVKINSEQGRIAVKYAEEAEQTMNRLHQDLQRVSWSKEKRNGSGKEDPEGRDQEA